MATNSDGSIVLSVSIDKSGVSSEIENLTKLIENSAKAENKTAIQAEKLNQAKLKTSQQQEKLLQQEEKTKQAIEKTTQAQEKTKQAVIKTESATKKLKSATNSISTSLSKIATTLGIAFGVRELLRFSNEASKLASQTEANLKRLSMLYGEAGQSVYDFAEQNAYAFGMSKATAYDAVADYGNIFRTFADGAESAKLTNQMLQATAVIASQTGRTYEDVFEKIRSGLYGNTRAIDDLGLSVRQASLLQTQAYQTVTGGVKKWNDLTDAELQQARALGIIEQAQIKYGNTVLQSTALTRSQFNAAFQDFKATWGQAVNVILMPVLRVITAILHYATLALRAVLKFFGKDLKFDSSGVSEINAGTAGIADNIDNASKNQKKLGKGVKDTNKELKKTLAGFDELEILTDKSADNAGDGAGGAGGGAGGIGGGEFDITDTGDGENFDVEGTSSKWQSALGALTGMLVGAGLISLGLILCMNKHPVLGVAAIGAGLLAIGVSAITLGEALDVDGARVALTLLTVISGLICITVGILLCVNGAIPIGVGAIAYGLGLLGASAYSIGEKMNPEEAKTTLANLAAFAGGALLAIGILLCWLTVWGWGIAAIIAGIGLLGYSAVAFGKSDDEGIKKWLLGIEMIAGGAMLGLGIILCWLTGPNPTNIGLIIAGVATLTFALANLQEGLIPDGIKNWINIIYAIVSVAFLVIGCILAFTGHVTPLSIGLIVAGAAGLATEIAVNWEWLKETLTGKIAALTAAISLALLALGVILIFTSGGTASPLAIGLIAVGAVGLATEIIVNWDYIYDKVSEVINKIKEWVSTWGLLVLGILLCFTGVGIPLGMALIKKGADNLATKEDPVWDTIVTKIKDAWASVKKFWNDNVAKYFSAKWWEDLGKKMINGLISKVIGGLNKLINKINSIDFDLPEILGGGHIGFSIPTLSVPQLAKGAVLPANQPFLAVVGDQKRGTNIEAPAELIKQMAIQAIQETQGSLQGQQTVREEHYYLDQTELMSVLYKLVKGGERIQGNSLINQGGSLI